MISHPAVYAVALVAGVAVCLISYFKNRPQPQNHRNRRPPSPPPPYDYPRKEKHDSNLRRRKPENDTSQTACKPRLPVSSMPSNSAISDSQSQIPKTEAPNTVSPIASGENTLNDGFSGSPHFLNDTNATNNILSVEDSNVAHLSNSDFWDRPVTTRNPSDVVSSPKSTEQSINSGEFEKINLVNCSKCIKVIDQESPKEAVPCKHLFHLVCITEHFKNSQNCPWCGVRVTSLNF